MEHRIAHKIILSPNLYARFCISELPNWSQNLIRRVTAKSVVFKSICNSTIICPIMTHMGLFESLLPVVFGYMSNFETSMPAIWLIAPQIGLGKKLVWQTFFKVGTIYFTLEAIFGQLV